MNSYIARFAGLVVAAGLMAGCGRSKTEPVPTPEPAIEAPVDTPDPVTDAESADVPDEAAPAGPHVHGFADLAITREGGTFEAELISPMANFGLPESEAEYSDVVLAELSGLIELDGGVCEETVPQPFTDNAGGHTDSIIHFSWTCAKPADVRAVRFAGFEAFPSFETVSAVFITGTEQKAGKLTPAAPELAVK